MRKPSVCRLITSCSEANLDADRSATVTRRPSDRRYFSPSRRPHASQRVLRHGDEGQIRALNDSSLADWHGDALDQATTDLQTEEAERAGAVRLLIEVALSFLHRTQRPVFACPRHGGASVFFVARHRRPTA